MRAPRVEPRELKKLTLSSPRCAVPRVLTEPTVMTEGSWPGELMLPKRSLPSSVRPKLPGSTTTVMPAAVALRTARASGSSTQLAAESAPRLRFMTRML